MALKTRVWTAGKLVLVAGALAATYVLFSVAGMRVALRTREVQVPDLSNRSANEATAIAADLGLTIRVDDTRRLDPKVAVDRVLTQEPAPGSVARRSRAIRIWLSGGPSAATVPALIGQNDRVAALRVAQNGLTLSVAEIRSPFHAPDVVVAQDPPATTAAGQVTLLVNRGERGVSYVMPDLIGVDGERAADLLRRLGFRVADVGSTPYPGAPPGIVLRQSPQAGFQIGPGEPISLEVSR